MNDVSKEGQEDLVNVDDVLESIDSDAAQSSERVEGMADVVKVIKEVKKSVKGTSLGGLLYKEGIEIDSRAWGSPDKDAELGLYFLKRSDNDKDNYEKFFRLMGPYLNWKRDVLKAYGGRLSRSDEKRILADTEFAKIATLEQEDGYQAFRALLVFVRKYGDRPELPKFVEALVRKDSRNRFKGVIGSSEGELRESLAQSLKGSDRTKEQNNWNMTAALLQMKQKILTTGNMELEYLVPSYALMMMYRRGELEQFGINDNNMVDMVSINDTRGYFNFARFEQRSGKLALNAGISVPKGLEEAVKKEIASVTQDLVPALNVQLANAKREGKTYRPPAIVEDWKYGLTYDAEQGVIFARGENRNGILNSLGGELAQEFSKGDDSEAAAA